MASNCQIPTPAEYVNQMLDYIEYSKNLYGKKVLENSCGQGNILLQIVRRYIESAKEENYSLHEIAFGLGKDIAAYEVDKNCIRLCKKRLNKLIRVYGLKKVRWNIKNKDFLKEDLNDKYDYIIGNPPYITYHDMDEEQRDLLRKYFCTCKRGRSDYCYAFIEASIKVLAPNGKMAYLVPYSIMTNKFAEELRKFLIPYLTQIYDYRTIKIFPEAITSSIVIICEGKKEKNFSYHLIAEKYSLKIPKEKLGNRWIVLGTQTAEGRKFGEYFEVRNSVATLYNKAFILKKYRKEGDYYIVDGYRIEKELVRDAVSTKSLNKKGEGEKIIFPYQIVNGEKVDYTLQEFETKFPGAAAYLKQFRTELSNRKADKSAEWFQYGRSQAITKVFGEKLIIPMVITQKIHIYKADEDAIPYAGYFIKSKGKGGLSLEEAKKILESKEFYKYVEICGTPTTPTSYRISVDDIKEYMVML